MPPFPKFMWGVVFNACVVFSFSFSFHSLLLFLCKKVETSCALASKNKDSYLLRRDTVYTKREEQQHKGEEAVKSPHGAAGQRWLAHFDPHALG